MLRPYSKLCSATLLMCWSAVVSY